MTKHYAVRSSMQQHTNFCFRNPRPYAFPGEKDLYHNVQILSVMIQVGSFGVLQVLCFRYDPFALDQVTYFLYVSFTFALTFPWSLDVAVIVTVPAFLNVTLPSLLTVATAVLLLSQETACSAAAG